VLTDPRSSTQAIACSLTSIWVMQRWSSLSSCNRHSWLRAATADHGLPLLDRHYCHIEAVHPFTSQVLLYVSEILSTRGEGKVGSQKTAWRARFLYDAPERD